MASVNKVIVLGNVGKDPEIRYSASGVAFTNLSVATTRTWKNKESGERQEETEWHRVVFADRLAEIVGEYVHKGSPIYIEGRLRTRKWQDKDGKDQYTTEIVAQGLQLLGSRDDQGGGQRDRGDDRGRSDTRGQQSAPRDNRSAPPQQRQQSRSAPQQNSGRSAPPRSSTGFDDMEDDIPF